MANLFGLSLPLPVFVSVPEFESFFVSVPDGVRCWRDSLRGALGIAPVSWR